MKIAFKGFRGFGNDSELLEISDLTILTGKNSSGKSTFIKLLKLLRDAFAGVSNLFDLANIVINIANETIGGQENLMSLQKVNQAKWVFTTQFEFFIDYHEIHLNFDILDYTMQVRSIEIFDKASLKNKKALCTFESSTVKVNTKYLYSKYNEYATLYNIFEEYRFKTEGDDNKSGENYEYQFDEIRKELGLTDDKIKKEIANHISASHVSCIIEEVGDFHRNEYNHPFKIIDLPGTYGYYNILWIMDEKTEFTRNEIEDLIEQSDFKYDIVSYISEVKTYDPSYDFITQFIEYYNFKIENFILSTKGFEFGTMDAQAEGAIQDIELKKKFYKYTNGGIVIELDYGMEFFEEVVSTKFHLLYHLAKGSALLFQEYITRFIKISSNIEFQSNVRNIPERSYNIYNSTSIFSAFIKHWKVLDSRERKFKLLFLKSYLNRFEIADDINIRFENNIGFIQLIKKGNSFSIIDEGSGISNILSCLLFITQSLVTNEEEEQTGYMSFPNKQILVFEEPESNLHPSLQSLLADLFVDIITTHDIRLIIETHSEYLIRKLQYIVAIGKVKNSSISLNYFDLSYKKNTPFISIKRIPISEDGILEDEFGPGFFDEANNLSINLFQLNQTQKN